MRGTDKIIVPVDEAQSLVGGISGASLYRMGSNGGLAKVKIGRRTFFRVDDLRVLAGLSGQSSQVHTAAVSGK